MLNYTQQATLALRAKIDQEWAEVQELFGAMPEELRAHTVRLAMDAAEKPKLLRGLLPGTLTLVSRLFRVAANELLVRHWEGRDGE